MSKRNPESASKGDQGALFVGLLVAQMGHQWHPRAGREVAIDGEIELFSTDRTSTAQFLSVQIKTRTGAAEQRPPRISCARQDVAYWCACDRPVLLVLVDPDAERAWFVCVQEYFGRNSATAHSVYFDLIADRFDVSVSSSLRELSVAWKHKSILEDASASQSVVTNRHALQQFHGALTLAIIDQAREQVVQSTPLFLDADMTLPGALPLQYLLARSVERLSDDRVFSTMLWRLGYLGPGAMLPPHALEFVDGLRHAALATRDQMSTLLRHDLTRRALAEMRIAIHDPEAPVASLMEQVRQLPRATAMHVAVLTQAAQPIRSITEVLSLQQESTPTDDLLKSQLFRDIHDLLERLSGGHSRLLNTFHDAVALALLAQRVERHRHDQVDGVGYFVTGSLRVTALLRDERLQHLFEVNDGLQPAAANHTQHDSVLRTPEYLVCRGTFGSLRRRDDNTVVRSRQTSADRLSLSEIKECASELTEVLGYLARTHPDPKHVFRLERLPINGVTLAAVVAYLQSVASLDTIWMADKAAGLRMLCQKTNYSDVEEFVITNYSRMVRWTRDEFASRVQSLARWREAHARIGARKSGGNGHDPGE